MLRIENSCVVSFPALLARTLCSMSSVAALRSAPSISRNSTRSESRAHRRHPVVRAQKVEEVQQATADEARVPSPAVNVIQTHPVPRWGAPCGASSMPRCVPPLPPPPASCCTSWPLRLPYPSCLMS